jgi:lipopolysaccharide export system protein LptC
MTPAPVERIKLPPGRERLARKASRRPTPDQADIARRRWQINVAKRVLPAAALLLLTLIAIWPELRSDTTTGRFAFRRGLVEPENGQLTRPRYNGVDEHLRPYTLTADSARQTSTDRIDLVGPIGDLSLESGGWMFGRGQAGVYMQTSGQLDLDGDVHLYRDDGTTLQTDNATIDLKSGAATSAARTHAEGPFGSLDAQGFSLLDRGAVIQFIGPTRLLLNGSKDSRTP